ncbi:Protein HESO1 [Camellia lanceoleosa]|uniref:Protein HESO1 n=1 Tax=Camellia lanceoleosa TaxID=1840588 RepID=A0ACC0IV65_9ERIC|nr:Protein HESO1 [Camellia lanceoleosa]
MAMGEKVLRKKAKKRELKGSQKNKLILEQIPALEELLRDVYVICRPKESDYYNRKDLVRIFNVIAKEIYGKSDDIPVVEQFGSFLMDIFSAKSDLDLSVNFSNNTVDFPKEKKIQTLRKFAKKLYALQRKGHVSSVHPILTAKVPILKIVDRGTGIECDISIENRDGIVKSQIVRLISSIDDRFQMLSFLMKTWAKAQDINSSKDRTMNSLSIILLVAFHLQTRDPPILPPFSAIFKDGTDPVMVGKIVNNFLDYGKRNKESLGELFVTLLNKLLSVETLWAKGLCASTYEGSWILKTWDSKIGCISVEDFTDRSQNVARAVGKKQVKKIYECIHLCMHYVFNFMNGKIEGTKLRELLFGRELLPAPVCTTKIDKRTVEPCIQTKKRRRTECSGETDGAIPVKTKKIPSGEGWEGTTPTSGWEGTLPTTVLGGKPPTTGWGGTPPMKGWGGAPPTISWGGAPSTNVWGGTPPTTGWGGTTTTKGSGATPPTTVWGGTPPMKAWGGTPPTTGWGGTQPTNGCGATQPTNGWGGTLPTTGLGGTPHTKGWGGTLPTTGWGGTTPTKGWGGTQPVTGLGGTQPTNGWGGTQLAKGWGGTQPTTGLGGTPHTKGWGGILPTTGLGGTPHTKGWGGTLPTTGWGGTTPTKGWGGTLPATGWGGTQPTNGWGGTQPTEGWGRTQPTKGCRETPPTKGWGGTPTEGWGGTPSVGWGGMQKAVVPNSIWRKEM